MSYNRMTMYSSSREYGGSRFVWWKDTTIHDQGNVLNGFKIMNPFKGYGVMFAGELCEYRLDGTGYLLKVYEVAEDVALDGTEVKLVCDGYKFIPEDGQILIKAPDDVNTKGKGAVISGVTIKNDPILGDVSTFTITAGALGELKKGDVLVDATKAGDDAEVLVKNPNTFCEYEAEFNKSVDPNRQNVNEYFSTIQHARVFEAKVNKKPKYVLDKNVSNIEGIFEL